MKFDLSALAGRTIQEIKLSFKTPADPAAVSSGSQVVRLVDNTSWAETSLTYTNRPRLGAAVGTISGTAADRWYGFRLDAAALQAKLGSLVSLAIETSSPDALLIASRETATKPQLEIPYC